MNLIKYIVLIIFLTGCSVVHKRSADGVAVRDVPFSTRDKGEDINSSMKKRLVILPFLNGSQATADGITDRSRESFISEMSAHHAAVIISPEDLKVDLGQYLKDNQYQLDQLFKPAAKVGVSALLEGKLIDVRIRRNAESVGLFRQIKSEVSVTVRVRMISTRNGKELLNKTFTEKTEDAATRVMEKVDQDRFFKDNPDFILSAILSAFKNISPAAMNALDTLAWEGKVALVQGDKVYLNVGRLSGVQIGDILKVTEEGEEVFDPETGGPIGKIPGRMKGTLEVVSYFGQDGAVAIVHSGSGFKENDKIELY